MSMSVENSYMEMEPNIVKAKFIVTNLRIYTLEFDQNIQMKELKTMIQVAAHLKKTISVYYVMVKNIQVTMKKLLIPYFQIKNWLFLIFKKVKAKLSMKLNFFSK